MRESYGIHEPATSSPVQSRDDRLVVLLVLGSGSAGLPQHLHRRANATKLARVPEELVDGQPDSTVTAIPPDALGYVLQIELNAPRPLLTLARPDAVNLVIDVAFVYRIERAPLSYPEVKGRAERFLNKRPVAPDDADVDVPMLSARESEELVQCRATRKPPSNGHGVQKRDDLSNVKRLPTMARRFASHVRIVDQGSHRPQLSNWAWMSSK